MPKSVFVDTLGLVQAGGAEQDQNGGKAEAIQPMRLGLLQQFVKHAMA